MRADLPIEHLEIRVAGVVQGVGFRPFVFRLALEHGLLGTVANNSRGVLIRVQGTAEALARFTEELRRTAPPAARVDNVWVQQLPLYDYTAFRILPSVHEEEAFTHVSPDLALCDECRRELYDPRDRRFAYPFVNCTRCGPRFTIIERMPYDRPQTTMRGFDLCPACAAEYAQPADRRFHAQPIACPTCGPEVRFLHCDDGTWKEQGRGRDALTQAMEILREGKILLLQGIGGFHLACDAGKEEAVLALRRRKKRDEKPFAIMFPSLNILREHCWTNEIEERLLTSSAAPIVLLRKRADSSLSGAVAPGVATFGAMLPYSPLHELLLHGFGGPLVMTSANHHDDPVSFEVPDALSRMSGVADAALIHNRPIHIFADDSVVKVMAGAPRLWRRARGYVPQSVHVPAAFRVPVLAFGPQLKNTFCLGKGHFALLSQHLGDLESDLAVRAFERALNHFLRLFDARIELAACDLHPDYASTRLAEAWTQSHGIPLVRVQHHHAHLVSCLAENEVTDKAIGLCLDGTGYGTDGTIWGGEVLIGDARSFVRAAHLQTVPMPGGELAAREPWRMALAWWREVFGADSLDNSSLSLGQAVRQNLGDSLWHSLLARGLWENVFPRTSSLGRLFDAVAALTFFGMRRQFEGQAAMLLEGMLGDEAASPYPFDITRPAADGPLVISPVPVFRALRQDLEHEVSPTIIARRFHEGVVWVFVRTCVLLRDETGINVVALSGGCFQNDFLLTRMSEELAGNGFRVLTHRQVPCGDGGVSLGQAVIANAQGVS